MFSFLKVKSEQILKSLLYTNQLGEKYLVITRGNDQVNEAKLKKLLKEEVFLDEKSNDKIGYLGPVDSELGKIIADIEATKLLNAVAGASKIGFHLLNVNYNRDWKATLTGDIRSVNDGESCPKCNKELKVDIGMEIGHTFALQDRYTKVLEANFVESMSLCSIIYQVYLHHEK